MPQQALTVNPEYNDEGQLVDFHVNGQHRGAHIDATIVEDEAGQSHYQIEEDPQSENTNFNDDEYISLLLETVPNLRDMLAYAEKDASFLPPGFSDEWNNMINAQDLNLDELHSMLDVLTDAYAAVVPDAELLDETDQWFDQIPQEQVDAQIDNIIDNPVTLDQVDQLTELHSQFKAGSVEDFIIRAGIDVAFGKADTQDMLNQAIDQFGPAKAYKAYTKLQTLLST